MSGMYTLRKEKNDEDFLHLVSLILRIQKGHLHILLPLMKVEKAIRLWDLVKESKLSRLTVQKGLDYMLQNGIVTIVQMNASRFYYENLVYISNPEVKGLLLALYEWYYRKEEENE